MLNRHFSTAAISGLAHSVPKGAAALALLYFFSSASTFFWAYIPRQMGALGWTGVQIGAFFMIKTVGQALATPGWSRIADRHKGCGPKVLKFQYIVAALAIALLPMASSWALGIVIAIMLGATVRCSPPLMDTMTLGTVGINRFGRIRSFGTLGFGLVALAFGLLGAQFDHAFLAKSAPWIMLTLLLLSLPIIKRLPRHDLETEKRPDHSEQPGANNSAPKPPLRELLKSPVVMLVFPVAALFVATQVPYELFLVVLAEERGFGAWLPGLALFIGIVGEMLGFLSFRKMLHRISPEIMIAVIVAISGVRWIITGTTTSPVVFAGLQILHGLTFAAFFMALLELMSREWGASLGASAQGLLYLCVFAAGNGVGTMVSGIVYDLGSASSLFTQAGIASFVILPGMMLALSSLQRREEVAAPAPGYCAQCNYIATPRMGVEIERDDTEQWLLLAR